MSEQDWGLSVDYGLGEGCMGISDEWPPVISCVFNVVGAWDDSAR